MTAETLVGTGCITKKQLGFSVYPEATYNYLTCCYDRSAVGISWVVHILWLSVWCSGPFSIKATHWRFWHWVLFLGKCAGYTSVLQIFLCFFFLWKQVLQLH